LRIGHRLRPLISRHQLIETNSIQITKAENVVNIDFRKQNRTFGQISARTVVLAAAGAFQDPAGRVYPVSIRQQSTLLGDMVNPNAAKILAIYPI
jgi:hypothetical protein